MGTYSVFLTVAAADVRGGLRRPESGPTLSRRNQYPLSWLSFAPRPSKFALSFPRNCFKPFLQSLSTQVTNIYTF